MSDVSETACRPEMVCSKRLQALIDGGHVRVDGAVRKAAHRLAGGEQIDVEVPPPIPQELAPEAAPLTVIYEDEHVLDLRLAYAITIHKSQGSEFPVVLIPCSMQHYVMLQRNLVYTALTRARKLAVFIGSRKALQFAVNNQTSLKRQTNLVDKIRRSVDA